MRPVTLLLISLALASMASAQLGLGLGLGGLGLGGLGLGLGRFGLLGGGLLGGIGLGSFGGLGGLGMFGRATFGGIRGKRDVDAITSHVTPAHEEINCILSKELLNCTGPHEIIQCPVEAHMPIDITATTHVKLTDLVFKDKIVNNTQILRIVPRKLINRMGHKLPNVSVYANKDLVSREFGFRICDPTCFDEIVTLVKELPEKVKVTCAKDATD